MLIRDIKVYILRDEPKVREVSSRARTLEKVPPALTGRFTRATQMHAQDESRVFGYRSETTLLTYKSIIRFVTDGDLDAYTDQPVLWSPVPFHFCREQMVWQANWFKTFVAHNLIGLDALDREHIWQKLWYAQRFNGVGRYVVDVIDTMLWDLAVRLTRQPLFKLLGGCVDRIPAYYNIDGNTIDEHVAEAVRVQALGFKGAKDHAYRGVEANIQLAKELRAAVGPDFALMHDCAWNYTYEDAVKVGRELERQNYTWMEEPLMDYDILGLKKLSDTLDVPILGREYGPALHGGQPYSDSAYLTMHAVDIARQRGLGITGQLKEAQLAECFGIDVHGSNPQIALAVGNEPWCEWGYVPPQVTQTPLTFKGTVRVENGYMFLDYGDGPVEEPNWDEVEKQALAIV